MTRKPGFFKGYMLLLLYALVYEQASCCVLHQEYFGAFGRICCKRVRSGAGPDKQKPEWYCGAIKIRRVGREAAPAHPSGHV